jgi:hypothetical protein
MFPRPDSPRYRRIGSLEPLPENVSHLSSSPNSPTEPVKVDILWHPPSEHIRITGFQPTSYYDDYLMTTSYSETMQLLQAEQAQKLHRLAQQAFPTASLGLCEIGCGDGSFLSHASRHFDTTLGIEPSSRFAAEARRSGQTVLEGFVSSSVSFTDHRFHAFASRQVFEHLEDPLDVLLGVRNLLLPGGVGLIEVPNGRRAIQSGRFFEIFPDHVNYFSRQSLNALAATAGFCVVECQPSFGDDYLELWVQLEGLGQPTTAKLDRLMQASREGLAAWRQQSSPDGVRAFFGCGAKALSVAAVNPEEFDRTFHFGIDSDPHKHGHFVPGTGVEIVGIANPLLSDVEEVFILALSYRQEIAAIIRKHMPRVRRIATFGDEGEVLHL